MPDKSLGQHWLKDRLTLEAIVDCAELSSDDTVLEIGPGLGTMTSALLRKAGGVIAVEFDGELAKRLPAQFPGKQLSVVNQDILSYDLTALPQNYKIVANIPYYITNKIVRAITETPNKPSVCVLLVQKEVAQRLAAQAGDMSILSLFAQNHFHVSLGPVVPAELFTPPPKVDSQVVVMKRRDTSIVSAGMQKKFSQIVKAGFSERRKKLRSALAGGMGISKQASEQMIHKAGLSPDVRAQELSLEDWLRLV